MAFIEPRSSENTMKHKTKRKKKKIPMTCNVMEIRFDGKRALVTGAGKGAVNNVINGDSR